MIQINKIASVFCLSIILYGCVGTATMDDVQPIQPHLSLLVLPLTEQQKSTEIIKRTTGEQGKVIVEQHAFNGGRVTAIFDQRYIGTAYPVNKQILTRIMDSPYVVNFIGDKRILGTVIEYKKTNLVDLTISLLGNKMVQTQYAMVTNPQKTKVCAVFSSAMLQSEETLYTITIKNSRMILDGALCRSVTEKNVVAMEKYTQQFLSTISKR